MEASKSDEAGAVYGDIEITVVDARGCARMRVVGGGHGISEEEKSAGAGRRQREGQQGQRCDGSGREECCVVGGRQQMGWREQKGERRGEERREEERRGEKR